MLIIICKIPNHHCVAIFVNHVTKENRPLGNFFHIQQTRVWYYWKFSAPHDLLCPLTSFPSRAAWELTFVTPCVSTTTCIIFCCKLCHSHLIVDWHIDLDVNAMSLLGMSPVLCDIYSNWLTLLMNHHHTDSIVIDMQHNTSYVAVYMNYNLVPHHSIFLLVLMLLVLLFSVFR